MKVEPVLLDCPPGDLCQRRYSGHGRGCPNYGKRETCPPQAERWTPDSCWGKAWYAIWNAFDFGAHVEKMRGLHPNWSQRQLECCLYWQGTARKKLKDEVIEFLHHVTPPLPTVEWVPEAHGVNVTETMRRAGIILEWPPKTVAYQVALVGMEEGKLR
jgi:hypothetical protein